MDDDQSCHLSSTKRRKKIMVGDSSSLSSCSLSSSSSSPPSHGIHSLVECSKGRMPRERSSESSIIPIKEYVLHVNITNIECSSTHMASRGKIR